MLALAAVAAHSTGDRTTALLASFLAGVACGESAERQRGHACREASNRPQLPGKRGRDVEVAGDLGKDR